MAQWPWEYLFVALNARLGTFYTPFWTVNLLLFIFTIVAYVWSTRGANGRGVLGNEWEYLLWIGVSTFGLNLIYAAHEAMLRTRRQVSDGVEATLKRPNRRGGSKKR